MSTQQLGINVITFVGEMLYLNKWIDGWMLKVANACSAMRSDIYINTALSYKFRSH